MVEVVAVELPAAAGVSVLPLHAARVRARTAATAVATRWVDVFM
jgi:hypothetical protein